MATNLPVGLDALYADDPANPGVKAHQQHHDALHAYTNTHDGAADPHPQYLTSSEADASYLAKSSDGTFRVIGGASEPAYENNWSSYSAVDASFEAPGFFKDSEAFVNLRGLVRNATAVTSGSVMFTLPTGYRPANTVMFGCLTTDASAVYQHGRVDVRADGAVVYQAGGLRYLTLSGVRFKVA